MFNRQEWQKRYREKHRARLNAGTSEWQSQNKEKRNTYMRSWNAKNNDKRYKYGVKARLKRRYGLVQGDYEAMLALQGGHCALCNTTPEQERYKKLNIDHCHETGIIRGLLCTSHNHAIGKMGDNEENLLRVLAYVRGSHAYKKRGG